MTSPATNEKNFKTQYIYMPMHNEKNSVINSDAKYKQIIKPTFINI